MNTSGGTNKWKYPSGGTNKMLNVTSGIQEVVWAHKP